MNEHSLQVLEYHRFLACLGDYAASGPGRAAILALRPAEDEKPRPHEALAAACLACRREGTLLLAVRFENPHELLALAAPEGAVLEGEALLEIRALLDAAHDLRQFLVAPERQRHAPMADLGERLEPCAELRRRLHRVFDPEGRIADDASPRLAEIRHDLVRLERRIRSRLESLLASSDYEEVVAERFIAMRNGRYVIPIKRDKRSRLSGVTHDQSNSGRTLFMEPAATLEDGNELAGLHLEERDEVRRILAALCDLLRADSPAIRSNYVLMRDYDLAYAVSAWAREYDCHYLPLGGELALHSARHPLLQRQFRQAGDEARLRPLDLEMPAGIAVLAVTGSNTGGKTVALKTIGLLTLLAQAGLPVAADPDSRLPRRRQVMADIGDEQSLEQNLSTFSGHMRQLGAILAECRRHPCLVLVDELGAGTDPLEGGALGCAILAELAELPALTFATTHLGAIKHFVHEHPRMENASMLFNLESLQPEYLLSVGRPGASHALAIAGRSGLPQTVVARAQGLIGSEQVRLENVLATMDEKERKLNEELADARSARDQAVRERDDVNKELKVLRKERRELLHQASHEAASLVENTRRQMDRLLAQARKAGQVDDAHKTLRDELQDRRDKLQKGIAQTAPRPDQPVKARELTVGDSVWVEVLKSKASVLAINADRKRVTVEVNGLPFEVSSQQLGKAEAGAPAAAEARVHRPIATRRVSTELNLLGMHVEEALTAVDRFIDDALLSGLGELRVVHGFGTGALKQAVHEHLKASGLVKKFRLGIDGRDPGGGGVTWIELA